MAATDFTIADVLEWARTKPADQDYNYSSNENCALCQFLRETDRAQFPTVGEGWADWSVAPYEGSQTKDGGYPNALEEPLQAGNFGELVARLKELCPETPVIKSDWARLDAYMADIELASA